MIKKAVVKKLDVIVTYNFTQEELDILKQIKEKGYIEYRDLNGSEIADNLIKYGFVKLVSDAWHYTVELTTLGNLAVESMD